MIMRYRTEESIIANILDVASNDGVSKTDILYGARLTYFQLVKYLGIMQDAKLLSYNEGHKLYKATEKGLKVMKLQQQVQDLMQHGQAQ
jgi:predicted transcriptional regulator